MQSEEMVFMTNVAVVGCGYWGPNLVRNFMVASGCGVKLICDTDNARLDHLKRLYPSLDTCGSLDEVLARPEIDAVAIATPVRFHYAMAKRCLDAGKHVLVEKPMARSVQECKDLVDAARTRGLVLMVGHTFVYSPTVRRIKEIIARGDLGRIHYIGARRLNLGLFQKDINVAWDLAPHDISIILYVLGEVPTGVNCQGRAHVVHGIEDVTNLTLAFASGTFATIQSSWLDPNKVREITFVGDKQMLVYDDMEPLEKIKIYDKRVEVPPHYDSFAEFQYSYHYGDVYSPYVKQVESLRFECQHFVDCIAGTSACDSDGVQGMAVVGILEAASASLMNGGGRVEVTAPVAAPVQGRAQ
jgi:predicted dehydrogenase